MADHIWVCIIYGWDSFEALRDTWVRLRGPCGDCGSPHLGPVLHDELWFHVCDHPAKDVLCTECIRERLGIWTFTPGMLKDIPWNMLWRAKHGEG